MVASDEALIEKPAGDGPCPGRPGRCCNPMIHKLNSYEKTWQKCLAWTCFLGFWWFLIRGIIQFIMFHFATMGCSASSLSGYRYSGGGWTCPSTSHAHCTVGSPQLNDFEHWDRCLEKDDAQDPDQQKCKYSPKDNVVPDITLMLENPSSMMGKGFNVYPATAGAATIDQAQVGMWWRTWGPWFWTYTYQDMHGHTTIYMRPTIMGMMGLYSESRIMRCDGEGDVWFFGEGSNWVGNRIRTFFGNVFGMQRQGSFKMYQGSSAWGTCLETFTGPSKSISFQKGSGNTANDLGSGVLTANSGSGAVLNEAGQRSDLWSVHKSGSTNYRDFPPYYVMSAATLLMAFRWITVRHSRGITAGHTSGSHTPATPPSYFLAETSNASVTFFEEDEEVHKDQVALEDGDEKANIEAGDAVGQKV